MSDIDEMLAMVKKLPAPEDAPKPLRDAIREAYDAMKADNFDAFADAFEAAMDIKSNLE